MTNPDKPKKLDIYRPVKPLEYPLIIHDVCYILGLKKGTLIRWEREGVVPPVSRNIEPRMSRGYSPADLTKLLQIMKEMKYRTWNEGEKLKFSWLDNFDTTQPCELITPSNYTITYEPSEPKGNNS